LRQDRRLNKISSAAFSLMIVLSGGAILFGCSESAKAPSTPVAITQKPTQKPVTQPTLTTAVTPTRPEYSYNPQGRRDPFAPIIVSAERKAQSGNRSPLERYDLNEFKLTGIVWGGFGYNAMVEGPDGKGYFVRVGTIIGPNKGVIKKITQNTMVVEEKYKTFSGVTERKEIVIELSKKQEGMQ
jgi:type IV pilus assembly protein PilP